MYTFIRTTGNERLVIPNEKLASDTIQQRHDPQPGDVRRGDRAASAVERSRRRRRGPAPRGRRAARRRLRERPRRRSHGRGARLGAEQRRRRARASPSCGCACTAGCANTGCSRHDPAASRSAAPRRPGALRPPPPQAPPRRTRPPAQTRGAARRCVVVARDRRRRDRRSAPRASSPSAPRATSSALRPAAIGENSLVYAADGSLLGVMPSERNRQPVPLGQMSPWVPKATVAIEDRRFYKHDGIDVEGIARALWEDVRAGQGRPGRLDDHAAAGAEPLHLPRADASSGRSRRRAWRSSSTGRSRRSRSSPTTSTSCRTATSRTGSRPARRRTSRKHARELNLPEAALLAGLPAGAVRPTTRSTTRGTRARAATRCSLAMLEGGAIDRAQYEWARRRPLGLKPGRLYKTIREPYFFTLRPRRARPRVRRRDRALRRPEGLHDDHPRLAARGRARDPRGAAATRPTRPRRSSRSIRRPARSAR